MRGLRVRNITNELGGERIDVIPYSSDLKTFIANAMHPAKLLDIELDPETKTVKLHVDQENSRLAFGRKAQNVRLTQRLIQWNISIVIQESEEEEFARKKQEAAEELAPLAGVSVEAARVLVEHGYLTIDGLGNASPDDLAAIEELTDDDRARIAQAVAVAKNAAPAQESAEDAAPSAEQP
jgi:N utilization substance protein A